ncbi:MAG: 30S ribosomal protein S9 [Chloroflexi bacterium]|nr:30S ribosomal protein S9 [Chloroflexota bacterium]
MSAQNYVTAAGRRKTAVARIRLLSGNGTVVVNGKPMAQFFGRATLHNEVLQPLRVTGTADKYNVMVRVEGGGTSGQAGAIRHGIARALVRIDEEFKKVLRQHGLLTRDPRMKERKKYGLKRARKAPQYTKR